MIEVNLIPERQKRRGSRRSASKGSRLCVAAHGVDEEEALSQLVGLVRERFGEAE